MTTTALVYATYAAAALGAFALYLAMPAATRRPRGIALAFGIVALGGILAILHQTVGAASDVYFFVLAFLTVGGAARVVTHPKPVYAALYFVMVVISSAVLALLAGAEFLAAALVIVYAGAILVTYVFVIMLAQQSESAADGGLASPLNYDTSAREPVAAVLAGFVLVATIAGVIIGRQQVGALPPAASADNPGNTMALGRVLLTDFAVSVELAGVLLMVAMIGAIALARKQLPRAVHDGDEMPIGEIGRRVRPF